MCLLLECLLPLFTWEEATVQLQPLLAVLPLLTPPATGYVIERYQASSKCYLLSINSKGTKCYFYYLYFIKKEHCLCAFLFKIVPQDGRMVQWYNSSALSIASVTRLGSPRTRIPPLKFDALTFRNCCKLIILLLQKSAS